MLTSVILLSQIGLPLHMHYCKGVLESVSLVVNPGCQDHEEVALVSDCCKKAEARDCPKTNNKCCDDQVTVLTQDITSVAPYLVQWADLAFVTETGTMLIPEVVAGQHPFLHTSVDNANGPPIYILHQALIYYA